MNRRLTRTLSIAARISPSSARYCSLKSRSGTRMARIALQFRSLVQCELWPNECVDLALLLLYDLGDVVASRPLLVGPFCLLHVLLRRPLRVRHARFFEWVPKGIRAGKDVCEAGSETRKAEEISASHWRRYSTNSTSTRLSMCPAACASSKNFRIAVRPTG